MLDLFAGTGALSFEAISRGASRALLVDRDPRALRAISRNAQALGVIEQVRAMRVDLTRGPAVFARHVIAPEGGFDLVFADPPYAEIGAVPLLLEGLMAAKRLAPGAWVVVEHASSHAWQWSKGLASDADYRYGQTHLSLGVYKAKGTT